LHQRPMIFVGRLPVPCFIIIEPSPTVQAHRSHTCLRPFCWIPPASPNASSACNVGYIAQETTSYTRQYIFYAITGNVVAGFPRPYFPAARYVLFFSAIYPPPLCLYPSSAKPLRHKATIVGCFPPSQLTERYTCRGAHDHATLGLCRPTSTTRRGFFPP